LPRAFAGLFFFVLTIFDYAIAPISINKDSAYYQRSIANRYAIAVRWPKSLWQLGSSLNNAELNQQNRQKLQAEISAFI
jgi:hypothetical protein